MIADGGWEDSRGLTAGGGLVSRPRRPDSGCLASFYGLSANQPAVESSHGVCCLYHDGPTAFDYLTYHRRVCGTQVPGSGRSI